ncbi:MAG: hypothetical protein RRB22_01250 [Gammaproteobacteria bacterium]|nr:hypothetical protein [Gammaproteobacteria bacterium]
MQLNRCPICHSRIDLVALCQDESGRELLATLSQLDTLSGTALVCYLGLFRPATRDLANDRALRLMREAMALHTEPAVLAAAMHESVQSMRSKQDAGAFKPLTNHNYLKRVLETVSVTALALPASGQGLAHSPTRPPSKTAQAIEALQHYPTPEGVPEWFTRTVCGSLAELVMMSMEGMPAYDTLTLQAERWLRELWPKRDWQQRCRFRGAKRLRDAFTTAADTKERWPSVRDVLSQVPKE